MSAKLFAHTLACSGLVFVLWFRLRDTTRKPLVIAFMMSAALLGLAPFLYRWTGGLTPRVTIHWAQLAFVIVAVVWFTPTPKGAVIHDRLDEDDDDLLTAPADTLKPTSVSLH